jgi:hypothetical protein
MLVVKTAGWAWTVSLRLVSGPSKQSLDSAKPSTRSASSNVSRARAELSASSRPMPTIWEP